MAHLFDTRHTPAADLEVRRVVLVRAGPWDHAREAEIDGEVRGPLEGAYDEASWNAVHRGVRLGDIVPTNGLTLAGCEAFEAPAGMAPVTVRFRTSTARGGYDEPSRWNDPVTLDTVYWRGATDHQSPAVEQLMGATDPSGRHPSPPADPATCTRYVVARLSGRPRRVEGDSAPSTVADAIPLLPPGDRGSWTRRGLPRCDALSRLLRRRVSGFERDEAWRARGAAHRHGRQGAPGPVPGRH